MSNPYKTIALNCPIKDNPRILAFDYAINAICRIEKPRILEIGCARNLDLGSMGGDGWSSIYWAEYIKNRGGSLTIVDIDVNAIEVAKIMLSDYLSEININFVVKDGIEFLRSDFEWDLVYLDGGDAEWQTYEMFKLIYRPRTVVLCDDAGKNSKCDRLKLHFRDGSLIHINEVHKMLFYPAVYYGPDYLRVGSQKIYYNRENPNRAYRNERALELGFSEWFADEMRNQITEIGVVCPHYDFYCEWNVYDTHNKDAEEIDYKGKNVLSVNIIQQLENHKVSSDFQKVCRVLDKIIKDSDNYLITFPLGCYRILEEHVKTNYKNNYILYKRNSFYTEKNEWKLLENQENWNWEYLDLEKNVGFYGNAVAICVITNQGKLLKLVKN